MAVSKSEIFIGDNSTAETDSHNIQRYSDQSFSVGPTFEVVRSRSESQLVDDDGQEEWEKNAFATSKALASSKLYGLIQTVFPPASIIEYLTRAH